MKKSSYIKLLLIGFLAICFRHEQLFAQQSLPTSGGNFSSSDGSVSFSVGQMVYTTYVGSNGSVAQGVQQPYEISIVTGQSTEIDENISFSVYPNPTKDLLKLNTSYNKYENIICQLFDITGRLLEDKKIVSNETLISMENFISGTYFLKIIENNTAVQTYKIIKN